QVQQTVTVGKGSQTVTFTSTNPGSVTTGSPDYTPTASSSAGLTVSISLDASSSGCLLISGSVSFTGAGTCVIDANQAGNANYDAAVQVQQSIAVGLTAQTVTFTSTAPTNATVGGATYTLAATGGASGNPVTFTVDASSTAGACSVTSAVVSFTGAGSCVIDANQAGNVIYAAAPEVEQSITVGKGSQTVTFQTSAPTGVTFESSPYLPTATASSGLPVAISLDASSTGCTLTSGTVTFTSAGTCVIDANQAGNANYNAAPQVQQSVVVSHVAQTVTFTSTAPGDAVAGGPDYTPTATASSALPVALTIDASSSSVCAITAGVVSFTGAGSCVIDANQAGNANYDAAPLVQQTFTVAKASQTVTFTSTAPTGATFGGPAYSPTASASSSLPVTVTVDASSSAVCAIVAGSVSFTGTGTCTLDANQSGSANYDAAPQVQQAFTVAKASQTVTFASTAPTNATVGGATYTPIASASSSLPVALSLDASSAGCALSGGVVRFTGVGTCVIDANQSGSANYDAAAQVQQTFGVVAGAPGAPTIGTATGGNGDATVTWTAPASNGSPITGYTVTAYQGGTAVGTVPAGPSVTSVVYPGLTDGTAYTFTVTATNSVNSGAPSGHSNSVTPRQPGPTAVSGLSVSLSNPYAGLSTSLTVRFTTSASGALGAGGTILVGAVVGSVLPTSASDYSISVTGPGSPAATVSSVVVPPGQPDSLVQLTLGTSTIGNGDTVTITIAGVTNSPTADPSSVLIMKTSSDVTFVSAFYALYGPGFTQGYWMAASDGGVFSYGGAAFYGSTGSLTLNKPIEGMTATADGKGYWMVASDGGVFAFGDAGFYGSTGSMTLNSPIVGMAVTPDGKGYWLVAADGGLFSYGDAGFYGSLGGQHLNEPIVAMAATPDGRGYWMTASDGGIFAFGDAGFYGSAGSLNLNKPIEGMTATPDGKGYWLVASDGGVFAYGDAQFHGSAGSLVLNSPIVGMATNVQSGGYYLVAADGGMFSYDAPFYGSLGGQHLNKPIVAMAS
ncbi:MAG: beta strand repeat-containing protein, partial [Acidimicrobiales bacterium]